MPNYIDMLIDKTEDVGSAYFLPIALMFHVRKVTFCQQHQNKSSMGSKLYFF